MTQKAPFFQRARPYVGFLLPFLVAIYPVVAAYVQNQNQLTPSQIIWPLGVNLILASIVTYLAWLLFRKVNQAAIFSSGILFVTLLFMPFRDIVVGRMRFYRLGWGQLLTVHAVFFYAIIILIALYMILKRADISWRKPTELVIVLYVALLCGNVYMVIQYQIANARFDKLPLNSPLAKAQPKTSASKPDIYYIILDRYASQETLSTQYGFDNKDFLGYLSGKGFTLANGNATHANYPFTIQSLSSSLNGQYLPNLSASDQNSVTSTKHLQDMIAQNGAAAFAKKQGYSFTQLGSWWDPTRNNPYADASLKSPHEIVVFGFHINISEYNGILLRQSVLQTVIGADIKVGKFTILGTTTIPSENIHAQSGLYELSQLKNIAADKNTAQPKLVFAHILLPHPPYVFDADGNKPSTKKKQTTKQLYLGQMAYTNKRIKDVVQSLTADPSRQPVILLQADEGPYPKRFQDHQATFDWHKATAKEKQEKTGVLSAYYLPGVDASVVYPGISPVNSFRLVFNSYFGTNLPYLEDKHYIDNAARPYKFIDLTSELK